MRRCFAILIALTGCFYAMGETMWHKDVLTVGYGEMWLLDGYLSPLVYNGEAISLSNEWWQPFKERTKYSTANWGHVGKLSLRGERVISEKKSNLIDALDIQGGWGAHYQFKWDFSASPGVEWSQLRVLVGPYIGADIMAKQMSRNVNKPYSIDAGIDACIMGEVNYAFACKSTAYSIGYGVQMNLFGVEWLPEYWTSYYEITEGVRTSENVHFSYAGNRQYLQQDFHFDMQFKHSSWRVGVKHEYMKYGVDKRPFRRESISGYIGAIFQYKTDPAPVISVF